MSFSFRPAFAFGLAVLLAGCATDRTFGSAADIEVTELTELPVPRGDYSYLIGAVEVLDIQVAGAEMLSGKFMTDADGRIDYPLLGNLDLSGRSPNQAARQIAEGLRGPYLVDPQVRVLPEEPPVATISVGGQVERPGTYPATGRQSLLRAINVAGGLADYAQLDDVLIMRTVDSQDYIGLYNLDAIQRGNYPDPTLYPNDVVMVGDSAARRRLETLLQLVPVATAVSIIIDRTAGN